MGPLFLTVIWLVFLTQAEGMKRKERGARELTAIQEQRQRWDSDNAASLENLNSIPSRSEIGEEKKRKRLKELSSTLDSLLVGRLPKRTKRQTDSGEITVELDGKIKVTADFEVISNLIEKVISLIKRKIKIEEIVSWLFLFNKYI